MRSLILFVLFSSIFILRWITLPSPLPETWTPSSTVRFTAPIIDQVEHTDTKTVVRKGIWYISIPGYAEIIPGDLVSFSGTVQKEVLLNTVTRIIMKDPTFEFLERRGERHLSLTEMILLTLLDLREHSVSLLEKWLPEPMSSLAAGILLGVKGQMPSTFHEALVNTGTLHIVAASGYNVSIVASVIMNLLGRFLSRGVVIGWGIVGIVGYVLLSGVSASVVRAGIMGSLTLIAYYFGRPAEARRLLWLTGALMLFFNPLMLIDIGFQLSFIATAGLLYLEPWLEKRLSRIPPLMGEYLFPTLAATLATTPLIIWHFGRVSWIAPLVNVLVLPVVPLIMLLTALSIAFGSIVFGLGKIVAWLVYVPLTWVVRVIQLLG